MSLKSLQLTVRGTDTLIPVKVVPNASRSRIAGLWNGRLKIAVAAPPEKGKANQAIAALLAKTLSVAKNRVTLESSPASPQKTFRLQDVTPEAVRAALDEFL